MSLEKEIGVQLFWRTKNNVILTPEGNAVLPYAIKILDACGDLDKVTNTWNRNIQGSIRVGYLDAAIRTILAGSIRAYREQYPEMDVSLWSCQMGELMHALNNNGVDLGIYLKYSNMRIPPELTYEHLKKDIVGVALPKDHPLIEKEDLFIDDFREYALILPSHAEFPEFAQLIRERVETKSRINTKVYEYTHIDTAQILVESGSGVAFLPSHIAMGIRGGEFRIVRDLQISLEIGVYRRRDNHTIGLEEFIATLKAMANSEEDYIGE